MDRAFHIYVASDFNKHVSAFDTEAFVIYSCEIGIAGLPALRLTKGVFIILGGIRSNNAGKVFALFSRQNLGIGKLRRMLVKLRIWSCGCRCLYGR